RWKVGCDRVPVLHARVAGPVEHQRLADHGAYIDRLERTRGLGRRTVAGEDPRDLAEPVDLREDLLHVAVQDRAKILLPVRVRAPEVLDRELDGRERVLDLVSDLPRHLAPGEYPRGPLLLGSRLAKPPDHSLERTEQLAELLGPSFGQPIRERFRADVPRGAALRADWACERAADGRGEREGEERTYYGREEDEIRQLSLPHA